MRSVRSTIGLHKLAAYPKNRTGKLLTCVIIDMREFNHLGEGIYRENSDIVCYQLCQRLTMAKKKEREKN